MDYPIDKKEEVLYEKMISIHTIFPFFFCLLINKRKGRNDLILK